MPHNTQFFRSFSNVRDIPSENRFQVAFVGRSNVGKSSLLNRLAGQKRLAKTSKTPGRTRLINFFLVDDKFYFVDLPGYGYAKASKKDRDEWGRLVESYFQKNNMLRGLILLLDCRRVPNEDDLMMIDWLDANDINYVVALTKADKLSRSRLMESRRKIEKLYGIDVVPFSSITGIGKKELWSWIDSLMSDRAN